MLVTFSENEDYASAVPFIILDIGSYQHYLLSVQRLGPAVVIRNND
ncbi:hypothetical protein HLB25_06070 [Dickeya dadantii]|nr:hypothetical protein [Dickeya dadantii]NPE66369.1 hypothetical protein [Dickeya dadantii]